MTKLIANPEEYFRGLEPSREDLLRSLERQAHQEQIPIIGPLVGELLYILLVGSKARSVLELGTAIGYSTIFLGKACQQNEGRVVTVEIESKFIERARVNLVSSGLDEVVTILQGNAFEIIHTFADHFDFIFLDIEKEDYHSILPYCRRALKIGGILVVDNVAFQAAQSFNEQIRGQREWKSVHLLAHLPGHSPEKDGLCFALRVS
jgi:caffeoyl-CoA O-methyltransferase